MELIAYFWDQDDASTVADQLGGELRRGRFHGEDDDEDHPWIVVLHDADRSTLDDLLTKHDGWLETAAAPVTTPPPLPTEPNRLKSPTPPLDHPPTSPHPFPANHHPPPPRHRSIRRVVDRGELEGSE